MGYRLGKEDLMVQEMDKKIRELHSNMGKPMPEGRAKHLVTQIADLGMYLKGMKKPSANRRKDKYLFDIAGMFKIDAEEKAKKQIRVAG